MSAALVTCGLSCLQGTVAALVLVGVVLICAMGTDRHTSRLTKWPLYGLGMWATWLIVNAADGQPDSLAGNAMTALVATVLLVYGRQIRGILDGESWWPKHSGVPTQHTQPPEVT